MPSEVKFKVKRRRSEYMTLLVCSSEKSISLFCCLWCISTSCPEPEVSSAASRISAAPSDSVASWQVSSVFLVRAHYPGADWAPSIDKQQAVTALLLIHDAGEPGQCKADERDSYQDIWLRIQLLTVKTDSLTICLYNCLCFCATWFKTEQKSLCL